MIDREKLIDEAYVIVSHEGVSALSMQKVAAACGTTVGSAYVYFPTKAELTAAVLKHLFAETSFEEHCAVREDKGFTFYLRCFHDAPNEVIMAMSVDWFVQIRRLSDSERCALETACALMTAHMEQGLRYVPDADDAVVQACLVGALYPESLCRFTLRGILTSFMEGSDCEALFALLSAALYAGAALYADATLCTDPVSSVGVTLYIDAETPLWGE